MPLPQNLKFSCGSLETNYGHKLRAAKPDADGTYEVVISAIGCPTRCGVIYEPESLVAAMNDPESRFNICLKDANLFGEYGHPVIRTKDDMPRLMQIDEHYTSHYFTKIWIDDSEPLMIDGFEGYPIRAKIKPSGPYGEVLRKQLEDPMQNTAFSLRSLCLPSSGRDNRYEYRKVQLLVTFDAVCAPGYQAATKRYVAGTEAFQEIPVDREILEHAVTARSGMESRPMLTMLDISKLYGDRDYTVNDQLIARGIGGQHSLVDKQGQGFDAASLLYRR